MNEIQKGCARIFQFGLKVGLQILSIPEPELLSGMGSLNKLPAKVSGLGLHHLLIVTGKHVSTMPQFNQLLHNLQSYSIQYTVFKDVSPNPTVSDVMHARKQYIDSGCDGLIAFGGGSPIDCAKAAGALIACPRKTLRQLKGYFKIGKKLPPLFAVPTTSGSGSEATLAAVITDADLHDKYAINDPKLIPKIAVLDPELTVSLPAQTTASTGMDALTHAIEAYIGRCGTHYTDEKAKIAVQLLFENLYAAYQNGGNLDARGKLSLASYDAGCAFTRAFVGYVHAIAHALGGLYNTPHGLANAILLPYILEFYGSSIQRKLAQLALWINIGTNDDPQRVLADRFISEIRKLNRNTGIPSTFQELKQEDIPQLAAHAMQEANPFYPVPKLMDQKQCSELLKRLLPNP